MRKRERLWGKVEPSWQKAFAWFSSQRGFATPINEDVFRRDYAIGSRYARRGHGAYEPSFYHPFVKRIRAGIVVFDI
jgi:hypothetical protein